MTAPHQDQAIGFLAADSYDANRTMLNALAFQAFGQSKAYYADSTADAFDKRNVRDGHYVVWGPEHFFVAVDNANADHEPEGREVHRLGQRHGHDDGVQLRRPRGDGERHPAVRDEGHARPGRRLRQAVHARRPPAAAAGSRSRR